MRNLKSFITILTLQIVFCVMILPSSSFSEEVTLFDQTFVRATGKPVTEEVLITVPAPAENYRVVVTNGNADGTSRCSSADVDIENTEDEVIDIADSDINGVSIIVPSDLNPHVYIIEKYVMLQPTNLLNLTLGSKPGCFLNIKVIGIDWTPPQIAITSSGNGDILGSPETPVSGTIDDPYATVTVNGIDAQNSRGVFQATIPLNYGSNNILAEAVDYYNNTNTDAITVTSDTIAPVITIDSTPEYISSSTLELSGTINDLTATTVSVQGQSVSLPAGGGTFSFTVNLTEGLNTLTVTAQDSAANTSDASRTIISDTIAPVVEITSPLSETFIGANTTAVAGTITDATPTTVVVNGLDAAVTDGAFNITSISLVEGSNTIIATATDSAGNTGTDEITVVSDTNPPVITIDPTPEYISSSTLELTGNIDDLTATTVSIQGQNVSVPAGGGTFTFTVNLTEGLNTLTVAAVDSAGNTAEASSTITSDTIAPVVEITSPLEGAYIGANTTAVAGSITDATPTTVVVNGLDAAVTDGAFNITSISLVEGSNTITATATDSAGNTGSAQITVVSDINPPVITIDPTPEYISSSTLELTGSIDDLTATTVSIQGQSISVPAGGGTFTFTVNLTEGLNTLTVTAVDSAGNSSEASSTIISDTIAPVVQITSPISGAFIAGNTTAVSGTISDATPTTVKVNGEDAAVSGVTYSITSITLNQGSNTITATATDAAGNTGLAQVTVVSDTSPPVITIDPTPEYISSNTITLTGSIDDLTATTVSIQGQSATVPAGGGTFSFTVNLTEGLNTLTVSAEDSAGNTSNASRIIISDTTPPVVTIDTPVDGLKTNVATQTVTGTVRDESPIDTVTINGNNLSLTNSNYANQYDLIEGINIIAVEATDIAGNIGYASIIAILDTIAPDPPVPDPLQSLTNATNITISGSAEIGSLVKIAGEGQATADASGRFSIPVSLNLDVMNTFSATATDEVGNESLPAAASILQDSIPPEVTAFSILADPKVTLNIPVSITFSEEPDTTTVNSTNITLESPLGSVSGTFSISGTEVILTPDTELAPNQLYTLTAGTGLRDRAGNNLATPYTATFETIRGPAFIIGEVYDDTKGLPLDGAEVQVLKINEEAPDPALTGLSNTMGRFSFENEGAGGEALIEAKKAGFTRALRSAGIEPNKSIEIFDFRLTPTEARTIQAAAGGTITSGDTTLSIPAGALPQDREITIASLSRQGMSYKLPIGWSPLYGVDITPWGTVLNTTATISIKNTWSITDTSQIIVALFEEDNLNWIASGRASIAGENINIEINRLGQYYLLLPDTAPSSPSIPAAEGEAILPSVTTIPDGGAATVEVNPEYVLSQEGSQGLTTVVLTTENIIPSGMTIGAKITEKYNLASGDVIAPETFTQDITMYSWPDDGNDNTLFAYFPVTPSKVYPFGVLTYGSVNIDIYLSGYEKAPEDNVIGDTGGTISVPHTISIIIPPSTLTGNTVFNLQKLTETDLPKAETPDLTFIGGLNLRMEGGAFKQDGLPHFIIPEPISDGTEIIITRVETIEQDTVQTAVATGIVNSGEVEITMCLRTPCIINGQYAFYIPSRAVGIITGRVMKTGIPVSGAVITVDNLPFKAITDASGSYTVLSLSGTYTITAAETSTGQKAVETGTISGGEIRNIELNLAETVPTVAAVIPHDKATAVDPAAGIEVTFTEPVDPLTIDNNTFMILQDRPGLNVDPIQVEGRISLTNSSITAVFTPEFELEPDTIYHIKLSGAITDSYGAHLIPFESVFTTAKVLGNEVLEPGELRAGLPDDNRYVTVQGGPGMAAPGTTVLVINNTQNIVLTIFAEEDGSFQGMIQATIEDEIIVEVRDLLGNITTLSTGLLTDGSGAAAVGPKGGTIYGTGGIKAFIPEGAFDAAVIVTISMVSEDTIQDVQMDPGLRTAGVFEIDTGGVEAKEELKVSVPAPDWVTPEHQLLITRVVNIRGFEELTLSCPAVLKDGYIESTSPPFPGITTGGDYAVTTWVHPEDGVAYTLIQTCSSTGAYSLGFAGFIFPVPSCTSTRITIPLTIPVDQTYNVTLTSLEGEPLDTVTIYGPPERGEFTEKIERLSSDVVPPAVISSSYPNGVGGILPDDNSITIELSEKVDPATVNTDTVTVRDSHGNIVKGEVYLTEDGKTIVFVPKYGYKYGETYTIKISGIKDYGKGEGNLIEPYISTFSTFKPEIIATVEMPRPRNIDKYKNYIVASSDINSSQSDLVIIDISDPYIPVIKSRTAIWSTMDLKAVPDITVAGQYGDYVTTIDGNGTNYSALRLFNVTAPASPFRSESVFLTSTWLHTTFTQERPGVPYAEGIPVRVTALGSNAYVGNIDVGIQGVDLTKVSPPKTAAQSALQGMLVDPLIRGVSSLENPVTGQNLILGAKYDGLIVVSPQLGLIGKAALESAFNITGVGAFPIDIDKDGNIGAAEDKDEDSMTSADELFDLAFVSTKQGVIVIDVTNPSLPKEIDNIPIYNSLSTVKVDRERRLAYVLTTGEMSIVSLKNLSPQGNPTGGIIDEDGDTVDDRILNIFPEAAGRDIVLSDDGTLAYIADYSGGAVKIMELDNTSYIKIIDKDGRAMRELEFSDGSKPEKQYHVEIKLNDDLNPDGLVCDQINLSLKVANDEGDLTNVAGLYPTTTNIELEDLTSIKCRSKEKFIITNLPEGEIENTNVIPIRGGIGNKVKVESVNLNMERDYSVSIEPIEVIVLAIDGLRQDVLYPEGLDSVQDGGKYRVNIDQLAGLKQILAGYDQPVNNQQYIMLPDVTAIFPSITLASWASIFTGKMPKDTGILGNEFFARDLSISFPERYNNPPGMISLSSGAFKGYDAFPNEGWWLFNKMEILSSDFIVPYQFDWREHVDPTRGPQNLLLDSKSKLVYETLSDTAGIRDYFDYRNNTFNNGEPFVVANNHYSRGAYWLTWDIELTYGSAAEWMDNGSWDKLQDYLDGRYTSGIPFFKKRNEVPFASVLTFYLGGLDHEAHDKGMGAYKGYFESFTDVKIKSFVDWLKDYDEFDNKIFIITSDHGHTAMPTDLTYKDPKLFGLEREADTSCELKVDNFDKRTTKNKEKYNNNLHIWELGNLFTQFPSPIEGIELKVLAPVEIADEVSGATADINEANIISALNGPMAHIYIKGTNWQDNPDSEILKLVIKRLYGVLKNGSIATGTLRKMINDHFPNLSTSIDKILLRRELKGVYEVVTGVTEDASGNPIIDTELLDTLDSTDYINPVERIKGMNHSDRSGDIVLIMKDDMGDTDQRFSTGVSCKSWHGGLNKSDSYVPFVVAYPGGNKYELNVITQKVCIDNLCEGNWKAKDLITEIIKKQYSGQ